MKTILSLTAVAVLTCFLVGCEASKGIGKDIENTGKNIQETVDKNQQIENIN